MAERTVAMRRRKTLATSLETAKLSTLSHEDPAECALPDATPDGGPKREADTKCMDDTYFHIHHQTVAQKKKLAV